MISAISMHEAGQSKLVLWDNPEGWDGGRGRGRDAGWGIHVHPWLIMLLYGKNHHNIVISLQLK